MKMLKNIILSGICTILFPIFISDKTLSFSNSFASIIFFVLLILLFKYTDEQNYEKRMKRYTCGLGFLFSLMTAYGYSLDNYGTIPYRNVYLIIAILMYTYVFSLLLCIVWSCLKEYEKVLSDEKPKKEIWKKLYQICDTIINHPIIICIFLLACWMPCYISVFPGNFVYDAAAEFNQIESGFNGNFPMLHSVLITWTLSIMYRLTGSYNAGIAVYTILQMLVLAIMFTHVIYKFSQYYVNRFLLSVLIFYYAVFPVIHILVTSTVRDILFSGLVTYTAFLFWLMFREKAAFMHPVLKPAFLGIMLVLTLLARNNNASLVMIFILFLISIFIWIWAGQGARKGAAVFVIVTVGGYFMLSSALTILCQPYKPANISSSLSILTQPIIRAYLSSDSNFTKEEEERLREFFYGQLIYLSKDGDATKFHLVRMDENHKFSDFIQLWARIGIKHRADYMDAILANTQQMWFPNSVINGYQQATTLYDSYDKCYFYVMEEIELPGIQQNFLPNVLNFYKNIGLMISFEKIPVISMLFSIGFQFWLVLNCCFYTAYRRGKALGISLAIILGYSLISACVPVILLRYFAALFFSFPIVIIFTFQPERIN